MKKENFMQQCKTCSMFNGCQRQLRKRRRIDLSKGRRVDLVSCSVFAEVESHEVWWNGPCEVKNMEDFGERMHGIFIQRNGGGA